ncbi:VOC family protein [Micromonospora sp. NPDC005174]|uniref:VOC family protein n=1 Tax=Micromonospora sp. NPDC005174 TaxID=3157018 RepID=UPI0033A446EF
MIPGQVPAAWSSRRRTPYDVVRWREREEGRGPLILGAVRVDDYRPPTWPSGERSQQIHFDLAADDSDSLDDAEARAIKLGAVKEEQQFAPARYRVLRDPAGYPFCLRR